MTKLAVRLLGGYRVELEGEAVYDFETDKARALLAYLIVEAGRPHRRESLAALLWPDRPEGVARANLRQALARVRRALREADHEPPAFLFVTSTDVQFNTASDYTLDVGELEAFADSPARHSRLLPDAFCGDFLAGLAVPDSQAFQEWALNRQEHYHRLAIEILDEQNAYFEGIGDYERAAAAAWLQVRLEPWLEEAHRRCMRALALAGRRDEALHQYESCRRALKTELGVEPAASTQALYADIRAGNIVAATQHAPRPRAPDRAGHLANGPESPATGLPALAGDASGHRSSDLAEGLAPWAAAEPSGEPPAARPGKQAASLVARENELSQLVRCLDSALAGQTGLTFVSGDAGSGKTALLEAFAASAMAEHPELLVAGARCSPGGRLDPFAPLRKLAEMLFGDLTSDVGWRLAGRDQVDRLQRATGLTLAALAEHGTGLVETLVPAASVLCRANQISAEGEVRPTAERPNWGPAPNTPLSQGALFDQLICTLAAIARKHPLLLLLDDLHWVDEASAAFLVDLGRELENTPLLVLVAYRSATVALGRRDPRSGQVTRHPLEAAINELRRVKGEIVIGLDRADGRAFVEAYVDTEPNRLGARFRDALYAHTGGHALFTVETLRNLQERGELVKDEAGRWLARESLDWGALPARVDAAIAERIERLPEVCRGILSCASVQGDDFTGELAAELAGLPAQEVLACLSGSCARQHHLVQPEGRERPGGQQRSIYRFTHHLFQKYLYDRLDPVERAQLHGAVAAALDRQAAGDPAERERLSPRLAWHYEAGGLGLQAARALHDAGCQAMRVSAYREALDRFDHGLALLPGEPPSPERTEIGGLLEVARLGPLRCLEGMGSAKLQGTLARAMEAWAGHAQGRARLILLLTEVEHAFATGQFEGALAVAERLRAETAQRGEEDLVGLAHFYVGAIHHHMGNPRQSEGYLDQVPAFLTPERCAELRAATGADLLAASLAYSALNQWLLGHPETALERSRQAVASVRADAAMIGQASSKALGAILRYLLRVDQDTMAEQSEECHRLCLQHGIRMWRAFAEVLLGRLMVMRGQDVAGIERMRGWIAAWRALGMAIGVDFLVVVLADSCLLAASRRASAEDAERAGLVASGLVAIEGMFRPVQLPCGQCHEAELHRLQGELLLARDGLAASGEALECFGKALKIGRERGALALELRAATSLVRLWQRRCGDQSETAPEGNSSPAAQSLQGVKSPQEELREVQAILREIYARHTEGFAFPDLQEAAALIRMAA